MIKKFSIVTIIIAVVILGAYYFQTKRVESLQKQERIKEAVGSTNISNQDIDNNNVCTDNELHVDSLDNDVKNNPKAMQIIHKKCLWVQDSKSIDLTGDSKQELVLNTSGWGCGSCHSRDLYILKDDQIIFNRQGDDLAIGEILSSEIGFQLTEPIRKAGEGLCCPTDGTVYTYIYSPDNTNHEYFKLTNTTIKRY